MEAPAETGEHLVKAKHRAVRRWPQPGDDPAGRGLFYALILVGLLGCKTATSLAV